MALTIGVDVGGTKIAAGLVDESGQVIARDRRESPASDAHAIEDTIADMVRGLRSREEAGGFDVAGMGVAAAGFVSADSSTVIFSPNLAWRDEPLKADLELRTGLPVIVENDANAAAWGEFRFGAAIDVDDMLMVTVGTGVGGGLVLDRSLYRGGGGLAAEIGHFCVVPDGLPCPCGSRGCWEQYASGSALVRIAREQAEADPEAASALVRTAGEVDLISGPLITEFAKRGDEFAVRQLEHVGHWLGTGLASLVAILDPTMIVIGGGVAQADELLLNPAVSRLSELLTGRGHRTPTTVVLASLGNHAGMVGAADQARVAFA